MPSYIIKVDWIENFLYTIETHYEQGIAIEDEKIYGVEYILDIKASLNTNGKINTNNMETENKLEIPYVDIKLFDNDIREHLVQEVITFINNLCYSKAMREILQELGILIEYTTCTTDTRYFVPKQKQLKSLVFRLFSKIDSEVIEKIQNTVNNNRHKCYMISDIDVEVSYFIDDDNYYCLKVEYKDKNMEKILSRWRNAWFKQ